MDTAQRLEAMAVFVRSGDFARAAEVGNQGVVHTAVDSAQYQCLQQLARGSESTVWSGTFLGEPVAIKKAIIGTGADLFRFRREVVSLASLAHPAIVPLLGARVLPQDYSIITPLYSKSLEVRPVLAGTQRALALARPHVPRCPPVPRQGPHQLQLTRKHCKIQYSLCTCRRVRIWCPGLLVLACCQCIPQPI
jgi:hypothetical protein